MTTTRTRASAPIESSGGADPARLSQAPPLEGEPRAPASKRARTPVEHRNDVCLVGDLTEPVEPRQRADVGEVLTFRVGVRLSAPADGSAGPAESREATGGRRDIVDCAVATPVLRRRLESYQGGDVVEVHGVLRHRFWNSGGRVQSRYEVDVTVLKRLARANPAGQ